MLNISEEEFNKIMRNPNRDQLYYPSNYYLITKFIKISDQVIRTFFNDEPISLLQIKYRGNPNK